MTSNGLKLDFFGEGHGETIFLEFPNGKIGIVDCGNQNFIEWFDKFIEERKVKNIDFIVWTHPHNDHTSRFAKLFELCESKNIIIDYFMRFGVSKFKVIADLIEEQYIKEITPEHIAEFAQFDYSIFADVYRPSCLIKTIEYIKALKEKQLINNLVNELRYGYTLFSRGSIDDNVEIFCIAPTEKDVELYKEKAINWAMRNVESIEFSPNSNLHNTISVALSIKFGETTIILGGDVLNNTWQSIFNERRHNIYSHIPLKLIKVPHHGSSTAYIKEMWDLWGNDIYSVICPLVKSSLPKIPDIENFIEHSKKIFILKDKNLCTLLDFLVQKILVCECQPITIAPEATNHLSFEIFPDGNINFNWE